MRAVPLLLLLLLRVLIALLFILILNPPILTPTPPPPLPLSFSYSIFLSQDKPDYFDASNTVKWDAWNKLAGMAKETAAQRYIAEAKRQRTPMSQR